VSGSSVDVLVAGGGTAGLSAAIAARAAGATTAVVDPAEGGWVGGNTALTSGAFRTTWERLEDLRTLAPVDDATARRIDLPPYPGAAFLADLVRLGDGRMDGTLARTLVAEARPALAWLAALGIRWELLVGRQSFVSGSRIRFWGNLAVGVQGGGRALVEAQRRALVDRGGVVLDGTRVVAVVRDAGRVTGVEVRDATGTREIRARAVVLASGGFEASGARVEAHLGSRWSRALVRGTPFASGDLLFAALAAGAAPAGEWEGCHAVAWDADARRDEDPGRIPRLSRQAYPWGIVVNRSGRRFLDEGADFRNYTYARYGREILAQPGSIAWQLFDAITVSFLTPDYATATRVEAPTIADLAARAGIDPSGLVATIEAYNASVADRVFDPAVLDGRSARGPGVEPQRSNWASPLVTPPFTAVPVRCGLTFTFGGLRIDRDGRVLGPDDRPLAGLYACGEIAGLFHGTIPGGTALTAATVFGRRAGAAAAGEATGRPGGA
jgi:tricarballylate dehydrogenase